MLFKNRQAAGNLLTKSLQEYKGKNSIILALPRGGVIVAYEVAKKLKIPLQILGVRKITTFRYPEFAVGAISENNTVILDENTITNLGIPKEELLVSIKNEKKELTRRIQLYRKNKKLPTLKGKTAIIIDDGLATGLTAQAAIIATQKLKPKDIIFASPVCAKDTTKNIKQQVDKLICLSMPPNFQAVSKWYQKFEQITDEKVIEILNNYRSIIDLHLPTR